MVMRLNEPFWSAWQRFGWPQGVAGYSVNEEAVKKALELKKKILVKNKYGDYEITPSKALQLAGRTSSSTGVSLLCIPKTAFKKLPSEVENGSVGLVGAIKDVPLPDNWEETRKKLHS